MTPGTTLSLASWWSGLDSGNKAEWTTACFAVLALMFAGFAAWSSHRLWRVEQKRDKAQDALNVERRETEARAAQADHVAAWWDAKTTTSFETLRSGQFDLAGTRRRVDRPVWGAVVINGSKLPVYDLRVEFRSTRDGTLRDFTKLAVFPPERRHIPPPKGELRRVAEQDESGLPVYAEGHDEFAVALTFRDTANRLWERNKYGELSYKGAAVIGELHVVQDDQTATGEGSVDNQVQ